MSPILTEKEIIEAYTIFLVPFCIFLMLAFLGLVFSYFKEARRR